jgi:hypothetical protein
LYSEAIRRALTERRQRLVRETGLPAREGRLRRLLATGDDFAKTNLTLA